jgi:hypothetical protein
MKIITLILNDKTIVIIEKNNNLNLKRKLLKILNRKFI